MLTRDEHYMQRCLQLAKLGSGNVAPNPMVGAVLVYENEIIGEGYHRNYGEAHAEVNCINSVKDMHLHLIEKSVLYVSLEPCSHYGKTPPCTNLIIEKKIPGVVIGCSDPFAEVNGKGIEKLRAAGVDVAVNILQQECIELNKRFFTFYTKQRPYIILKWAQTADKKIGYANKNRLLISNDITNRLVHKWRAEESAILVGTNTVFNDDPKLTSRLWSGKNPVRLVIDKVLKLPANALIFTADAPVIIFNNHKHSLEADQHLENLIYYFKVDDKQNALSAISNACYALKIQSILVEGGSKLLQSVIDENFYDEVRIITNENLRVYNSDLVAAPVLNNYKPAKMEKLLSDKIEYFFL